MKDFFYRLSVRIQKFMLGRYGIDRLYKVLMVIYLVAILITAIVGRHIDVRLHYTITALLFCIFAFAIYRVFSKNIEKRRAENQRWIAFEGSVKKKFRILGDRWKFRKTHIFRKCPQCKAVLRLKRQRGTHSVTCPHCSKSFKIRVLF